MISSFNSTIELYSLTYSTERNNGYLRFIWLTLTSFGVLGLGLEKLVKSGREKLAEVGTAIGGSRCVELGRGGTLRSEISIV